MRSAHSSGHRLRPPGRDLRQQDPAYGAVRRPRRRVDREHAEDGAGQERHLRRPRSLGQPGEPPRRRRPDENLHRPRNLGRQIVERDQRSLLGELLDRARTRPRAPGPAGPPRTTTPCSDGSRRSPPAAQTANARSLFTVPPARTDSTNSVLVTPYEEANGGQLGDQRLVGRPVPTQPGMLGQQPRDQPRRGVVPHPERVARNACRSSASTGPSGQPQPLHAARSGGGAPVSGTATRSRTPPPDGPSPTQGTSEHRTLARSAFDRRAFGPTRLPTTGSAPSRCAATRGAAMEGSPVEGCGGWRARR